MPDKVVCPKCGKELPSWFRFYSDEAKHKIHFQKDKYLETNKVEFS